MNGINNIIKFNELQKFFIIKFNQVRKLNADSFFNQFVTIVLYFQPGL